jgi:hypothetical protein
VQKKSETRKASPVYLLIFNWFLTLVLSRSSLRVCSQSSQFFPGNGHPYRFIFKTHKFNNSFEQNAKRLFYHAKILLPGVKILIPGVKDFVPGVKGLVLSA